MKKVLGLIIQLVIVVYVVIFAVINKQTTEITFFFGTPTYVMPLFLLILFTLFLGFMLGVIIMFVSKLSLNSQIKKLTKQSAEYQNEITRLKNITLSGSEAVHIPNEIKNKTSADIGSDIKNILR